MVPYSPTYWCYLVHHVYGSSIFLGNDVEREGSDRADISLPGSQLQLLQDAVGAASGKLRLYTLEFYDFCILGLVQPCYFYCHAFYV